MNSEFQNSVQEERKKWLSCAKCKIASFRRKVVWGDGILPAEVLLIGEAPGKSEDLLGRPFIGASGQLLGRAVDDAFCILKSEGLLLPRKRRFFITNVLACRPTDEQDGSNRQPKPEECANCFPRLERIIAFAQARVTIFLGKVADANCRAIIPNGILLNHPSYILRKGGSGSAEYQAFVRRLAGALATAYARDKQRSAAETLLGKNIDTKA